MTQPSLAQFRELAAEFPVVPVYRVRIADCSTPVSVFMRLDRSQNAALLESVEGGETWARFSMIGCDPGIVYESRDGRARIRTVSGVVERHEETPLSALEELLEQHRTAESDELPRMAGAAIGFAGYDIVRRFERLPETATDDQGLPEARFIFYESAILFDHVAHSAILVVHARPGDDPDATYRDANRRLDDLERLLGGPTPADENRELSGKVRFHSRTGKAKFKDGVRKIIEYIRAGDAVQVVLSHRLEAEIEADPFDVYRALRVINPSPYMFFLRMDDCTIAGASPEVLVRRERDLTQVRPIAGTRPRGRDEESDRRLEEELRQDEKERAEHIMLVDLGRNDLGRISRFGEVETNELMVVERYSHVMHLVSNVRGRLREGMSNAEVLRACFPAGTVSGAPKIRAMEIIEELEPLRRGLYAGAVGYIDFHGNMDTAIAIRTLLFQGSRVSIGVGAGIVADSDPEMEWEETLRKASACIRACEVASGGFVDFRRTDPSLPTLDDAADRNGATAE